MRVLIYAIVFCLLATAAFIASPDIRASLASDTPQSWQVSAEQPREGQLLIRKMRGISFPLRASTSYSPDPDLGQKRFVRDGLTVRSYYVYGAQDAGRPRPAVLLLHGGNRTGQSLVDMWRPVADEHGLVLIAPNALAGSWGGSDVPMINEVLEVAQTRHGADPERLFLFGHSSGARLAHQLTNRLAPPFRASVAHAGYDASATPISRNTGAPMRHYLGEYDHVFKTEIARDVARRYAKAGHNYELITIPGHTHWFYDIGPQIAADAWAWFDGL